VRKSPFATRNSPFAAIGATVRRADEDRWLAGRFAHPIIRERLIALYAVNYEIARSAETVSTAALGDIRHAWWREALEEIHTGQGPRTHPALEAYAQAHSKAPFLRHPWSIIIDARAADLESAPFADFDTLTKYVDATAGALMQLAIAACDADAPASAMTFIQPAARAWGYAGLLRAAPVWVARGRRLGVDLAVLRRAGLDAHSRARQEAKIIPEKFFPAFGYVTLASRYLRAPESEPSLFERQIRLVTASATGRL